MGTRYVRDTPLASAIDLNFGLEDESLSFDVEHIYSELEIGNDLEIQIREKEDSKLGFVNLVHSENKTVVVIN